MPPRLVAAVVAGLVTGHGAPKLLTPAHRASDRQNWRAIELVLEGSVFLLMGLELDGILHQLGTDQAVALGIRIALLALGAIMLVRAAYVALLVGSLNRGMRREPAIRQRLEVIGSSLPEVGKKVTTRRLESMTSRIRRKQHDLDYYAAAPLTWREGGVLTWAGMRGVVTLVAAQTLPTSVPNRHLLVFIAFVVAALSLLVQGGTLPWVVRWLRPARPDPVALAAERDGLERHLRQAVSDEIKTMPPDELPSFVVEHVLERFNSGDIPEASVLEESRALRLRLIEAQRESLLRLRSTGAFSSQVLEERLAQLDAQQIALETHQDGES